MIQNHIPAPNKLFDIKAVAKQNSINKIEMIFFHTPSPKPINKWCPRQESNLHLSLRRALLYPFNYGGIVQNYNSESKATNNQNINLAYYFKMSSILMGSPKL